MSDQTVYERIGGAATVQRLATRFYAIMSEKPQAATIRAMHAEDLSRVSDSLAEFLAGWMGGPRTWFMREDRPCIMSLHKVMPIGPGERDQWLACMSEALALEIEDAALRDDIAAALFRTADAMRSR